LKKSRYKIGDIVLVKSPAGECIPKIHVKLIERIIVLPRAGKLIGFKKSMDWGGYSGWNAEVVYQEEADILRKTWSIPFSGPGDRTFVYDSSIIKKPRNIKIAGCGKTISRGKTTIRKKRVKK
jgi:hypothetical protein